MLKRFERGEVGRGKEGECVGWSGGGVHFVGDILL
jgi:hypothetical protein